ncbi:MAG: bile acid:sodium symporter [Burkholderiaceae bacterium]|nr:bile acid:sodium symporter [Burkholderiaceae bacterium]
MKLLLSRLTQSLVRNWFLLGMVGVVLLASLLPEIGRSGGILHAERLSDIGIALVFFLHGVGISFENLKSGMLRWPLHLVVQTFTFVIFPLLFYPLRALIAALFGDSLPPELILGFLYLCVLPSTISSSVAMTGAARGNVPAAIFNATLSSLIGIGLTPLLVNLMAHSHAEHLPLLPTMLGIAKLLLLPLLLGQLMRPLIGSWLRRYETITNKVDKAVILLLVYTAFCDSVAGGLWTNQGVGMIATTLLGTGLLLAVVLLLSSFTAARLGFNRADQIAVVFCGSKKTLASGIPMAKLLFGAHPSLGLIVLPIMFYHQLQLFVCSILAERYARRTGP